MRFGVSIFAAVAVTHSGGGSVRLVKRSVMRFILEVQSCFLVASGRSPGEVVGEPENRGRKIIGHQGEHMLLLICVRRRDVDHFVGRRIEKRRRVCQNAQLRAGLFSVRDVVQ